MRSETDAHATDRFELSRFITAQQNVYDTAVAELRRGYKETHWMWFIFPQLLGLGSSSTSKLYAIRSLDEARAYLQHTILGPRLLECCRALLAVEGRSASDIMGWPDDQKLLSSMTLFSIANDSFPEFRAVIQKYFDGKQDARTRALLDL